MSVCIQKEKNKIKKPQNNQFGFLLRYHNTFVHIKTTYYLHSTGRVGEEEGKKVTAFPRPCLCMSTKTHTWTNGITFKI